jgi:hypothetical protein
MRKARAKAMQTKRFCKTQLFLFTPISPYFLWLSNDHQTQMTDYMLQLMYTIEQLAMSTMLFYDLVIRPIPLNIANGQLLREALCSFNKAKKIINLMMIITILHYSMLDINHKPIIEEMTRICYLARLFCKKFRTYFGK